MLTYIFIKIRTARMMWPAMSLIMMLQKTPIIRVLVHAEFANGVRAGSLLRAAVPVAVATAATSHTLTGATAIVTNPASPVAGEVGTNLAVAFALSGTGVTPESYSIIGVLPPGLSVPGATGSTGNLTLNASSGSVSGTPTAPGMYTVNITAFDSPNRGLGVYGSSDEFALSFNITGSSDVAPTISVQPQPQTVDIGGTAMFSVTASGSPTPTFQWRKDNVNLVGQTSPTLTITNAQVSDAGDYSVFISNSEGSVTSNAVVLTVNLPAAPEITVNPVAMTSLDGSDAFFSIQASGSGLTFQWRKGGADLPGETNSSLFISGISTADAGAYSVRVSNAGGFADSSAANLTVASSGTVRLASLSTRAQVGAGNNVVIPGFFIIGAGNKNLLVRGAGPALARLGVTGELKDPTLNIIPFGESDSIAFNDNWPDAPNQTEMESVRKSVFAFKLDPSTDDASLLLSVPPGGYTATIAGVNQTTGVGLVEVYDADPFGSTSTLTSISARAQVGTGGNILIPGIGIQGDVAITLLIRAIGPRLANTPFNIAGTLEDPEMVILRALGGGLSEFVASNDDWGQNPDVAALEAARKKVSGFGLGSGSKDASILVVLNPGAYTIQVSGKNGSTGVALVEIYRVGPDI